MIYVDAFDAKAYPSSPLDRVTPGDEVLITRRGRPAHIHRTSGAGADREHDREAARAPHGPEARRLGWMNLRDEGRG